MKLGDAVLLPEWPNCSSLELVLLVVFQVY